MLFSLLVLVYHTFYHQAYDREYQQDRRDEARAVTIDEQYAKIDPQPPFNTIVTDPKQAIIVKATGKTALSVRPIATGGFVNPLNIQPYDIYTPQSMPKPTSIYVIYGNRLCQKPLTE